ncbi:hypothetical protein FB45DRAFT_958442 [Roridomyces roridus]|uniref:Transcription factor CBF/NF-Y/archaeal histone domain-containing protein n=1 Tax=Roridomyces roridus TaxID=1738132 RepID=A0AAD7AYL3_9AGAR|nr:hypothetical protein FB45DRAFT_958442 [Roridomyces roridus]
MDSDSLAPSVASPPVLDADEEEDELISDVEDAVEREPGESLLPAHRLEGIIQAEGVMGTLALSKEGLFLLSIATEEFIKRLVQGGQRQAGVERRTMVTYRDMAATTEQYQEFMFLKETIPYPVSLSEALQLREAKEKEILEDALVAPTSTVATTSTSKSKGKSRANGKEKQSRASSGSRTQSRAHSQVRWEHQEVPPPPPSNGHVSAPPNPRGGPEAGWTRWPNGENFITVNPLPIGSSPLANGFTTSIHQPPPPPVNGHASRDTEPPPSRQHANYWQRGDAPRTSAPPPLDATVVSGSSPNDLPPPAQAVSSQAAPSTLLFGAPGDPPSLISHNPGRTIYSQKKVAQ